MTLPTVGSLYKRPDGSTVLLLGVSFGNPTKVAYPSEQRFFPGGHLLDWTDRYSTENLIKVDYFNLSTQQKESLALAKDSFFLIFEELTV